MTFIVIIASKLAKRRCALLCTFGINATYKCFLSHSISPSPVKCHFDDNGIKTITMSDVESRNSLSIRMMEHLIHHLIVDNSNPKLRACIIAAEGNVFSAGHNLKELGPETDNKHKEVFATATELMTTIINCPVPIIAQVNGVAAAAGCQLVAQCDLSFCTEQSQFSTPGIKLGVFCSTPGIALARTGMPKSVLLQMLFTGEPINGADAAALGLVCGCFATERQLLDNVATVCSQIVAKNRAIIALGKQFFYQQIEHGNVLQAYQQGATVMVNNLQLEDSKSAINSFLLKSKKRK